MSPRLPQSVSAKPGQTTPGVDAVCVREARKRAWRAMGMAGADGDSQSAAIAEAATNADAVSMGTAPPVMHTCIKRLVRTEQARSAPGAY